MDPCFLTIPSPLPLPAHPPSPFPTAGPARPPCSQLQSKFHQLERQVERRYGESEACRMMAEECGREARKLEGERERLKERINAIDTDMCQVWPVAIAMSYVP